MSKGKGKPPVKKPRSQDPGKSTPVTPVAATPSAKTMPRGRSKVAAEAEKVGATPVSPTPSLAAQGKAAKVRATTVGPLITAPVGGPLEAAQALLPGKPVETSVPRLLVAAISRPGAYTFELVVVDDLGAVSAPSRLVVKVAG